MAIANNYQMYYKILDKLEQFKPTLNYDDIKVGDVLHIPPLGIYERCDHIVTSKFPNYLITERVIGNQRNKSSLFKTEISYRFAVKIGNIHDDE